MNGLQNIEVLILAAGLGRRLGNVTATTPKCLLDVHGESLLERSLRSIRTQGARSVTIVTGYRRQDIENYIGASETREMTFTLRYNPRFKEGGSASSLSVGLNEVAAGRSVLLLESDLLYNPEFLLRALRCTESTVLTAEISGSNDEVYAYVDDRGALRRLTKRQEGVPLNLTRAPGEFAGISLLTPSACEVLRELGAPGVTGDYEDLLVGLSAHAPVGVKHCPGLTWCEVDTVADLRRARMQAMIPFITQDSPVPI